MTDAGTTRASSCVVAGLTERALQVALEFHEAGIRRIALSFAQRYGKFGYASASRVAHDLTFRFEAYARISSIISVVSAALLGIGIGAMFEASLIVSTGKFIDQITRGTSDLGYHVHCRQQGARYRGLDSIVLKSALAEIRVILQLSTLDNIVGVAMIYCRESTRCHS